MYIYVYITYIYVLYVLYVYYIYICNIQIYYTYRFIDL